MMGPDKLLKCFLAFQFSFTPQPDYDDLGKMQLDLADAQ